MNMLIEIAYYGAIVGIGYRSGRFIVRKTKGGKAR